MVFIWIWWGEEPQDGLKPPRFFDDLDGSFSYGRAYDPWDAHYSRVIENQLDVVHLPFVPTNNTSRGAGGRTLVDGPLVEWVADDAFYVYVFNRRDDGTPPRRPEELSKPVDGFRLEFIFPNLWQNHISEQTRIVAAFVPVDKAHTLLYLRFCQNFVRAPLLRELFNWLSMPFNLLIAHQDRRVVVTQRPKPSGLKIGEKLIQGDRPIVEYRRRRQELIEEATAPYYTGLSVHEGDLLDTTWICAGLDAVFVLAGPSLCTGRHPSLRRWQSRRSQRLAGRGMAGGSARTAAGFPEGSRAGGPGSFQLRGFGLGVSTCSTGARAGTRLFAILALSRGQGFGRHLWHLGRSDALGKGRPCWACLQGPSFCPRLRMLGPQFWGCYVSLRIFCCGRLIPLSS